MAKKKTNYISENLEWSFELLQEFDHEIGRIAREKFHLDTYPNQIEVISAEQMMDAYSSVGMPVGYNHWSFGKQFVTVNQRYQRGQMGLAYEIVINSSPCIAYLMEENTLPMQALVIAHASYGHNSFFKGNYLFDTWTDASSIIDYLVFAKKYIRDCEQKYGVDEVETFLDSCHSLMNYGVDRYKRPYPISAVEEKQRQTERAAYLQAQVNELWKTIPSSKKDQQENQARKFLQEPQENLLYFIEKNAPLLEPWQREIVRIVRKIAQYFYPQRQTQVMNEGWATFWHYTILYELFNEGLVNDGFMVEMLHSHTNVVYQPPFDSPYYSGINPYALGFGMMTDIRRICEQPTEEDKHWFPDFAGSDWLETLHFAMKNFKDESFIQQFLSPKLIRDFKLFSIVDNEKNPELEVGAIHNDEGFRYIRERLSNQYNLSMNEPNIQIVDVDLKGDRTLYLEHIQHNDRPLSEDTDEVIKHLHTLWKFDVHLSTITDGKTSKEYHCPDSNNSNAEKKTAK